VTVTAFDPADGAFVADPYPASAALRAAGRVLYDQRSDHWLVPHHADVSVLLLNAGHEATVNATGIGWWQLFRHPDQLDRLHGDPALLPRATDELLRFDTPLQMFERGVLQDVEICGVAVPKGAELGLLFGSANRDPAVFDDPDRLDVGRRHNPHLSFGAGALWVTT
jgi:cytochrome P450